ncbi:MAG: SurA N-terminal domain-containing protein [Pseudomonadota bacterium]
MARICLVLTIFAALILSGVPSMAQTRIVAVVNGSPITSYDVGQRQRLLRLTGARGNTREIALNELIDESIQNRATKAARINVSDSEVDSAIADIAKRAKISAAQLTGALRQAGVSESTLRARIKSQLGFSRLVRVRFRQFARVTEQDLVAALLRDEERENVIESPRYKLHQVTIALPDNPSASRLNQAKARASELQGKFQSCTQGIPMARKARNVVVRNFGNRMGVEFPPPVRKTLDETRVGGLSEPIEQRRGLVMFAVCEKEMVKSANAAMKELEPEMTSERGEAFSKQFLRQLKRDAVIERRG